MKSMRKRSEERAKTQVKRLKDDNSTEEMSTRQIKVKDKLFKTMSIQNNDEINPKGAMTSRDLMKTESQFYNTDSKDSSLDNTNNPNFKAIASSSFAELAAQSIEALKQPCFKDNQRRRSRSRNDRINLGDNEDSPLAQKSEKLNFEEIKQSLKRDKTFRSIKSFKSVSTNSPYVVLNSPFKNIDSPPSSQMLDSSQADIIKQRMNNEIRNMFSSS